VAAAAQKSSQRASPAAVEVTVCVRTSGQLVCQFACANHGSSALQSAGRRTTVDRWPSRHASPADFASGKLPHYPRSLSRARAFYLSTPARPSAALFFARPRTPGRVLFLFLFIHLSASATLAVVSLSAPLLASYAAYVAIAPRLPSSWACVHC
jgi:hypothetical protein